MVVHWSFCFFFVKQKTAYEMRISDWSSDVCSSDLLGEPVDGRSVRFPRGSPVPEPLQPAERIVGLVEQLFRVIDRRSVIGAQEQEAKIGRASCRERVCQYV